MLSACYERLSWLPSAPGDFKARVKEIAGLATEGRAWGDAVRLLANHALDEAQLVRLARTIEARRAAGQSLGALQPCRLGLAGNGTLDLLAAPLVGTFGRYGFALEVVCVDYDQHLAAALDPTSPLNSSSPDAVVIALDWRGLPLRVTPGDAQAAGETVVSALGFVDTIRAGIASGSGAPCLISTLAAPPETLTGGLDRALPGTLRNLCDRVNLGIAERVLTGPDRLLDVASLAETVGLANWHDPTLWNTAKSQFPTAFAPLWADHVARLFAAMKGKSRRVLVLDLDNTLWGGVVGDDGLEGILIGQGDATGEAHLEVQRTALALRQRGVVLAVSSKNDDDIARRPFREHPDMLLTLDHIAVFQANWNDKASNIKTIADELSLGLDSFVLLDDNPAERALVRETLPEVAVPELPEDPALFARTLSAAGYFELPMLSAEDVGRAEMYQLNARRAELKSQVADMDAYLRSLDMEMIVSPFDPVGRARIAQLINKSNQFNLTTRRYSEPEVAALETDPSIMTLQVRLSDRFGDNGMISVIVCRTVDGGAWEIDTWLMSCRVLGRGVERMVLREILDLARARSVTRLIGRYIPTARNGMVAEHYAKLGFTLNGTLADGETCWSLDTDNQVPEAPIKVRRIGFRVLAAA